MISPSLLSDVMFCLLLQACIVGGGQLLERSIAPAPPCCARPLVP
ncbi:MAG: hypothetical protein WBN89_06250 [Prochlorococcaceae cyanobacterium]